MACGSTSLEVGSSAEATPLRPNEPTFVVALPAGAADPDAAQKALVSEVKLAMEGWQVAPEGRRLPVFTSEAFYLDSKVERLGSAASAVEIKANVLVSGYPDRNLKMILRGSARASGPHAEEAATRGAYTGALRGLPEAIAASTTPAAATP